MTRVLSIDPGDRYSAYTLLAPDRKPLDFGKVPNDDLRVMLRDNLTIQADLVGVEMIASYGMPVGREVFETCVWIGRFVEVLADAGIPHQLVYRRDVKLHHCGVLRAKDSNVRQALVDRFAGGVRNGGKGVKAEPGWFYGFAADVWQAYAVGVYLADTTGDPSHRLPSDLPCRIGGDGRCRERMHYVMLA